MTQLMIVFHNNGRVYFTSQEPEAIAEAWQWRARGYATVVVEYPVDAMRQASAAGMTLFLG